MRTAQLLLEVRKIPAAHFRRQNRELVFVCRALQRHNLIAAPAQCVRIPGQADIKLEALPGPVLQISRRALCPAQARICLSLCLTMSMMSETTALAVGREPAPRP